MLVTMGGINDVLTIVEERSGITRATMKYSVPVRLPTWAIRSENAN